MTYVWDWGDLLFRWLHVVAAIAWIGGSFYYIALDYHLRPPADPDDAERGVGGEAWEIHGGGFYRVEKFTVAPKTLPSPLHWFKWEAYTTWLSGLGLFVVFYYVHASTYLVDRSVADIPSWAAILISLGGLVLAWLVYDGLCRVLGDREWLLAAAVFAFVCVSAWAACELFSGRAAYVQVGAMIGTMMAANVFIVIIPAHWELIRAKESGREPDPRWNFRGKQRSVHNNYLTLPVVFAMLSNHFPLTYGHSHAWLILVALMAIGAWIRHFFNLHHQGRDRWWILVTAGAAIVVLAVLIRPRDNAASAGEEPVPFARVQAIVEARCVPCHSAHPTQAGFDTAPRNVLLDTRAEIESRAAAIKQQAVDTKAMPLGNATGMTQTERDVLARWVSAR